MGQRCCKYLCCFEAGGLLRAGGGGGADVGAGHDPEGL